MKEVKFDGMAFVLEVNDRLDRLFKLQEKQADLISDILTDLDTLLRLYQETL